MSELTLKQQERLDRAISRQLGVKICGKCHTGIVRGGGICDWCKDGHPTLTINPRSNKRPLGLRAK